LNKIRTTFNQGVVFGDMALKLTHWRKKTALAANSGGESLLDDLPVCGSNTAELQSNGGVGFAVFTERSG
jgi:hypothetical protein